MRVWFYLFGFFPKPLGATFSALRLARSLRERGVEVRFMVEDQGPDWRDGGLYEGFPVRSFPLQAPGKQRKLRGLVRFTRFIRENRTEFDLFHVHGGGHVNLFLAWWVTLITRKPALLKITSDGWDTPEGMRAQKWGRFLLFAYRKLRGVVAMTSGQAKKCRDWNLPAHVDVIPNGVDVSVYTPVDARTKEQLRAAEGLPDAAFIACYAGWLGHGKGTDVLAEVFRQLETTHPRFHLLVVGDYLGGRGEHVNGADALPSSSRIHHIGRTDHVERYMQLSDLFVFPSRREGFGTVQIEAMACGLPCIVNDLPGVSSDIFPDESAGFRIAGNHAGAYIEKIKQLMDDGDLRARMAAAARSRAVSVFSSAVVADRYLSFYRTLMSSR